MAGGEEVVVKIFRSHLTIFPKNHNTIHRTHCLRMRICGGWHDEDGNFLKTSTKEWGITLNILDIIFNTASSSSSGLVGKRDEGSRNENIFENFLCVVIYRTICRSSRIEKAPQGFFPFPQLSFTLWLSRRYFPASPKQQRWIRNIFSSSSLFCVVFQSLQITFRPHTRVELPAAKSKVEG